MARHCRIAAGYRLLPMVVLLLAVCGREASGDYADALDKCILFFEGQRSGYLPPTQRMQWRGDSAVTDGKDIGVDLTGGYYDAGDNVKFGFPMAFTATVLSWSIIEFGPNMGSTQLGHGLDAVKWATDYLLKTSSQPGKVHVQVGDPYADHNCWERPEGMDTARTVYTVDASMPGSEVAAETAAAMAAASIAFKESDPAYAAMLIGRAMEVFEFADKHRGSYSDGLKKWVCPFYCDFSGYMDELVWAAAWIYKATDNPYYWNYVTSNINQIANSGVGEFGWDDKHAGINVLIFKLLLSTNQPNSLLLNGARDFACTVLPESPTKTVQYSPGGLIFKSGGSNIQHATALSFLLVVYARYLTAAGNWTVQCGPNMSPVPPSRLIEVAKGQADYILGANPSGMSYMVGYGLKYPQRIHHRGSSCPSVKQMPKPLGCQGGTPYFNSSNPNPNVLVGALVGGPDIDDVYADDRALFVQSEPTTYLNAPFVGVLAYLANPF